MKKTLTIVLILVMLLGIGAAAQAEQPVLIGLLLSDTSNQFFSTLLDAAQQACAERGYEFVSYDAANDTAKDVSNMEDLISMQPSVILYNPVDADAAGAVVELANAASIPVITVDRSANGGDVLCHIASDNVYGGRIAGEYILSLLPDGGEIAEIQGQAGASAAKERGEGFHQAVDGAPGFTVVSSQVGDWDRTKALEITENVMLAYPDVKAVFCHNDVMALGVVEACQQAGRSDIIIVGFDADTDALTAIQDGTMAATVQQLPAMMGIGGVEQAEAYLSGATLPAFIGVEVALITE